MKYLSRLMMLCRKVTANVLRLGEVAEYEKINYQF